MAGIFDIFTGQSAVDAANAQKAGITAGVNAATPALASGRDALTTNFSSALQPFLQNYGTATAGTKSLTDLLGITGDPSQVEAKLAATPGYQFALNTGDENVLRNAARTGPLNSGGTNLDLQKFGQGLADQTYQSTVQNLLPFLGASNAAATGGANVSTGLGTALNQNYGNLGQLGYTAQTNIGNANANADLAQGKGISNLWNFGLDAAKAVVGAPTGTFSSLGNLFGAGGGGNNFAQTGSPYAFGSGGYSGAGPFQP